MYNRTVTCESFVKCEVNVLLLFVLGSHTGRKQPGNEGPTWGGRHCSKTQDPCPPADLRGGVDF